MILTTLLYSIPFLLLYQVVQSYFLIKYIPGPLLARFTNLYRLLQVYRRNPHNDQLTLHRQYGDLVRYGPNTVSVSGPEYITQIYGIDKRLRKSDYYAVFQNIVNGQRAASLVAMTDETLHSQTKRQIAHAYALSTLVEFEPLVDSTTEVFLDYLDRNFAQPQEPCDLGRWLQFYAFDVIGELTFSKRLGFIEQGEDVNNIIRSIGANFDYFSVLGQVPWLDSCLGKNPIYVKYFRKPVASPILKYAQTLLRERLDQDRTSEEKNHGHSSSKDFLSRFLQLRKEPTDSESSNDERPMTDGTLLSHLFMNINAGSDTIASTVRAIFYHLLRNPSSLAKLTSELTIAHEQGNLTLPVPTWSETQSPQHLTYLRAVIKEGLRINPALSLPLERIVSPSGLNLVTASSSTTSQDNPTTTATTTYLPPGTIVGINPYVLHRDTRIFGPQPDEWNPDRWLSSSPPSSSSSSSKTTDTPNDEDRITKMTNSLLTFGHGKRTCLGKNIAYLELHKVVPAILMRFNLDFVAEIQHKIEKEAKRGRRWEWEVRNGWVLNQKGLIVDLTPRK